MSYTQNLIPNPSFEIDLSGYTSLSGTTLTQDFDNSLFGNTSMRVDTDGTIPGEGFYSPMTTEFSSGTYSGSLYILGDGPDTHLTVSLVMNPGGVVKSSVPVILSEGWQRITLDGISVPNGTTNLYLLVQTTQANIETFWVDGVQIENNSSSTEYCDGDQYGCVWDGSPGLSTSTRAVEFLASSDGFASADGSIIITIPGEIFQISSSGTIIVTGDASAQEIDRVAVFDDFAMYPIGVPDPAMTYVSYTNGGIATGANGAPSSRPYGLFIPPLDYPVSEGKAWSRAAYASVGFKFLGVGPGNYQYLDDIQFEKFNINSVTSNWSSTSRYTGGDIVAVNMHLYECISPAFGSGQAPVSTPFPVNNTWWEYTGDTYGPTSFSTPRETQTIVKPTVINLCRNPSFETSLNYWTAQGDCTLSRDNTSVSAEIGSYSCKASVADETVANPGLYTDITRLIVGRTYTVSAYIQGSGSLGDVSATCGGGGTNLSGQGVPYGGDATKNIGYGQGPYGGVYPLGNTANFPLNTWLRISFSFTAQNYTERLTLVASPVNSPTYPINFWVDAVMVEEGEILHDYFDGSFGFDYLWELNGIAGESRSYYYEGRRVKEYILSDIIQDNTPMGITAADPLFAVPYTQ